MCAFLEIGAISHFLIICIKVLMQFTSHFEFAQFLTLLGFTFWHTRSLHLHNKWSEGFLPGSIATSAPVGSLLHSALGNVMSETVVHMKRPFKNWEISALQKGQPTVQLSDVRRRNFCFLLKNGINSLHSI